MQVDIIPISSLHLDPANARKHGQRNLDLIKASLARFGQQRPIVVDANNVVRAGNGTLAAAKALGWRTVAAVRSDLAGVEMTAYAIADNRSAELATWDGQVLSAALADPAVGDVGFTAAEWDAVGAVPPEADDGRGGVRPDLTLGPERWLVVVTADGEAHQAELLARFAADGLACKAVVG